MAARMSPGGLSATAQQLVFQCDKATGPITGINSLKLSSRRQLGPGLSSFRSASREICRPVVVNMHNSNLQADTEGSDEAALKEASNNPTFSRRAAAIGLVVTGGVSLITPYGTPFGSATELANAGQAVLSGMEFGELSDVLNAYAFKYPLNLPGKSSKFAWVETRKPERYSSAAPLAPDARQRIVSERLDYRNNIVISVSVGPPNSAFLREPDSKQWTARDVARSVLADKSTARLTPEQKLQEIAIDDTYKEEIDGETYWYYEYLLQKSPTNFDRSPDVYRHSLAVSASRQGFIYSLNISTLQSLWNEMEPTIREAVASFHLTPVTSDYVPPWKDPWRFW